MWVISSAVVSWRLDAVSCMQSSIAYFWLWRGHKLITLPGNNVAVGNNNAKTCRFLESKNGLSLSQIVALFLSLGFCRLSLNQKKIVATFLSNVACHQNPLEGLMNDISWKSDVKSRRQDQTQLDSSSESKKKWANHKQCSSVFVSHAVQKVMLVGCDWWFLVHIFL